MRRCMIHICLHSYLPHCGHLRPPHTTFKLLKSACMMITVSFCLQLRLLLVTIHHKNLSHHLSIRNYVIGQRLVGVFVYVKSAQTLPYASSTLLQNTTVVPRSKQRWSNGQKVIYGGKNRHFA